MSSNAALVEIRMTDISWCPSYRIVPTQYPAVQIFESISNPKDLEAVLEIEAMTDDVVREMSGKLRLIPAEDKIVGEGAGRIMPCFLILDPEPPGSRFSNSEFGAYYAGNNLETAISETIFHREKFLAETSLKAQEIDNVLILADIQGVLHDIRSMQTSRSELYHATNYADSQAFARALRKHQSFGIIYDSVRNSGGQCVAILRPRIISNCRDSNIITYTWDGTRITGHYKKDGFTSI